MGKITVELNADAVDDIIVNELVDTRASLVEDYISGTRAVFSFDPQEDRVAIAKVIKALETVIDWYTPHGTYTFDELETFDA